MEKQGKASYNTYRLKKGQVKKYDQNRKSVF